MEVNVNLSEKAQRDFMLVQRATNGDQRAFAELMGRYRDAIYYMLLKMVNNASDAEDLTIEAFGKAFKNITQYAPNYAFSTWLFKIATNNCIDFIRKKKASHVSLDHNDEEHEKASMDLQAPVLDPEESLINDQKIKLMRSVVSKLKPRYRKLIELRYFNELSYEEISVELELPIGTVKAQLFRARELLYNILKNTPGKM
ncbi:MAG: polymerase subunit sigma-24 [Bacteroidetes bacterium]|jgi:RNA polymerase sigma factor (sigma-70 family)|nr:polymerase subunit sigma-24 [Bacteroidota bacterium]